MWPAGTWIKGLWSGIWTNYENTGGGMTAYNLRYCEILASGTYYDVMVGVTDLTQLDTVLNAWATQVIGKGITTVLDLPSALVQNQNITELSTLSTKTLDNMVYVYT
jgi:hypothetical protein